MKFKAVAQNLATRLLDPLERGSLRLARYILTISRPTRSVAPLVSGLITRPYDTMLSIPRAPSTSSSALRYSFSAGPVTDPPTAALG